MHITIYYAYDKDIFIYSNGLKITDEDIRTIRNYYPQVKGINIGLHDPKTFDKLICKFTADNLFRFHVEDIYRDMLEKKHKGYVDFHYWHRNDCDMPNEDVKILKQGTVELSPLTAIEF